MRMTMSNLSKLTPKHVAKMSRAKPAKTTKPKPVRSRQTAGERPGAAKKNRGISTADVAEKMNELKGRQKAVADRDAANQKAEKTERLERSMSKGQAKFAASLRIPKR